MPQIRFESYRKESRFISPLKDYQEDVHLIEYRRDPLTGTMSIVGHNLEDKKKMFFGATDQELIQKVTQESQASCFMCPDKVTTITPKYPKEFLPQERITTGEATLFPNLFPLSEFHAVCALSHAHYLNLRDFTPELLSDGIQSCLEFIRYIFSMKKVKYITINSNYLFPAGASVIHPHLQVVGGDSPYTFLTQIFDGSQRYFKKTHSNYWEDLITTEKATRERYIGRTGSIEWLASFSPIGANEVQGIVKKKSNFLELTSAETQSLGVGLSKILTFYETEGYSTFNFTIYSGPLGKAVEWFWCNVRIISRPNIYKNYRADDYFFQKLLGTEIVIIRPETIAEKLKTIF
ncbi:MAG: hypothetical protein ACE5R6_08700 [Candidatus Heimdallarchaeota archaeon]